MLNEQWRTIPSFPDYEASNLGRVRRRTPAKNTFPGLILKTPPNRNGYLKVAMSRDGKMFHTTVHRVVAEAFIGFRPKGKQVNHKDFVKSNCRVENLEYMTRQENENHAYRNGRKANSFRDRLSALSPTRLINKNQVREIRRLRDSGLTYKQISASYPISETQISRICRRLRWGWLL